MRPSVKKLLLFGTTAPYADAMLALDFVGSRSAGTPYYMLNGVSYASVTNMPGWTYTGGTPAGTGSYAPKADGSLQFFPSVTNLLTYSEQFDNAAWTKFAAPITADAIAAPTGTTSADKMTPTAASSLHYTVQSTTNSTGQFTSSVYAKSAGYTNFRLNMTDNATGSVYGSVDLTAGTVAMTSDGTWTGGSASIQALSNGWYRVTVTGTRVSGTSTALRIDAQDASGNLSFTGDGTSGIYIWGAQLELGSTASTYIPTTTAAVTVAPPRITDAGYLAEEARTNLLLRSQEFDNSYWTKTSTAVTANQIVAPDGTLTADKLDETATSGGHNVQSVSTTVSSGAAYTHTFYLKAAERSYAAVYDVTRAQGKFFNLSTGTVMGNLIGAPDSATITSAGNGWWRCTITITTTSTGSIASVWTSTDGTTYSYNGVAGSGIYIWQADLQAGSFATSPIPTTSVAVTRSADVGYINAFSAPTDGTVLVTGSAATLSNTPVLFGGGTDATNSIYAGTSTVGNHWNGLTPIGATGTFTVSPAINSLALAYVGTASRALSVNGSAGISGATTKGTFNRVMVGQRGDGTATQSANGPIRRIVIYPRAMSNSELQAITTAGAY